MSELFGNVKRDKEQKEKSKQKYHCNAKMQGPGNGISHLALAHMSTQAWQKDGTHYQSCGSCGPLSGDFVELNSKLPISA